MSRWFRFYGEALNDPKVQSLPGDLFKTWINLLCIASQHDGQLPASSELAYLLRRRSDYVQRDLSDLAGRGLLDDENGVLKPHKWHDRQYKSDTSNERVKRYRNAKCNVTSTVTETPPDNRVQNTDTEREKTVSRAVAPATRTCEPDRFPEFWKAYPKRDGANPKEPARKKFIAAVKSGTAPEVLIAAARTYAEREAKLEHIGTPYIAMAVTWLNQKRWGDYTEAEQPATTGPPDWLTPEQLQDWRGGWRPGMPSSREILGGHGGERQADEQRPKPVELAPLDADGLRVRQADERVGSDRARHRGPQTVGSILRRIGLGADGVSQAAAGQLGDDALPDSGLAS